MRPFKPFYIFLLVGLFVISCQKDTLEPVQEIAEPSQEFTVPDIPDDIAKLMSEEDLARFSAGPGEEYFERLDLSNARRSHGRWHPVLMKLGYHLQIGPIGGTSCEPGDFVPCFGPGSPPDPTDCLTSIVGASGITVADGYWFTNEVHSEYYPVFCGPDYSGYGEGFYHLSDGMLWLEAKNGPFMYDENENATFCRKGQYVSGKSEGKFSGAMGWEIMISYTAAENSPSIDPEGKGYSDVIIFGWVYY